MALSTSLPTTLVTSAAPPWLACGFDCSMNHFGLVVVDHHGEVLWHTFLTKLVGDAKQGGTRLPPEFTVKGNQGEKDFKRLRWMRTLLDSTVGQLEVKFPSTTIYFGVEDYPQGKITGRVLQIAEVGGHVRTRITDNPQYRLRLHEPKSVKIFATGKGDAEKEQMIAEARKSWISDVWNLSESIQEDLADAYALAQMVRVEALVRLGVTTLEALTDKQRQVFLRTTKTYPINLLARPWLVG